MRTINIYIFLSFPMLTCCFINCQNNEKTIQHEKTVQHDKIITQVNTIQSEDIILMNVKSGEFVYLLKPMTGQKIEETFGKASSIEKEDRSDESDRDAAPWTSISYDGLILELSGDSIEDVTVSGNNWKIQNFTINANLQEIRNRYEFLAKKDNKYLFKVPAFDGVLFVEADGNNLVTRIGISSS